MTDAAGVSVGRAQPRVGNAVAGTGQAVAQTVREVPLPGHVLPGTSLDAVAYGSPMKRIDSACISPSCCSERWWPPGTISSRFGSPAAA